KHFSSLGWKEYCGRTDRRTEKLLTFVSVMKTKTKAIHSAYQGKDAYGALAMLCIIRRQYHIGES
ncbi:MAG: hypothetical protein ACI3Y8_02960, partial [Candidatus Cryptobacteroides sp.]